MSTTTKTQVIGPLGGTAARRVGNGGAVARQRHHAAERLPATRNREGVVCGRGRNDARGLGRLAGLPLDVGLGDQRGADLRARSAGPARSGRATSAVFRLWCAWDCRVPPTSLDFQHADHLQDVRALNRRGTGGSRALRLPALRRAGHDAGRGRSAARTPGTRATACRGCRAPRT